MPPELRQIGRAYFARSPSSKVWVSFDDLSDEVRKRLWQKIHDGAFDEEDDEELF